MNTCFPARKQNGDNYATLDEMMRLIGREPHGSWLAGTNNMWHGGIHISEVSAPGSLLTPETTATAVPLPCMADGGVVAWRLGRDYQKARYLSHAVQYSTTFVLVKSVCKPDPDNAQTWLEFYSLYMGLAPLSAFEKCRCMKVIADGGVRKHPQGQYESSQPDVIPDASEGTLAKDARVIILKEGLFTYRGQSGQPFGLAQELDDEGRECGKPFRVTTSPVYMAPDGEQYARLPVWMQQAVAKGVFDAVVKPDTPLTISAGDAIGFLGEDIAPAGMAKISPSAYAHIEVLSTDSRMPGFLANPGGVNTGRKYIRIHPDAVLYIDSGETFIRTPITVNKDKHLILPVDKCNPREWEGQTYYQAGKNYWLRQDDVDVINQFDLNGLGFTALEEESTPDMSASIKEEWVTSTCRWLAEQVMPERGVRETLTSRFYQSVAEKLDSDRSGDLSGREVYAALHHPDMGVRDIVSRMVVKHESEWYGGSGHQKWTAFFQDYDTLRIDFAKKWLDDMEWMSQVAPFTAGQAVWHMHPVVFLDAINVLVPSVEEARVRAFMRMLRVGEGTVGEIGYETLFGGQSFVKDYHKDFSDHPQISITRGNLTSTAAGAYQIMGYTWNDPKMVSHREKVGITDFTPKSQDEFCVLIFKYKRKNSLDKIMSGDIDGALDILSYEWASLPPGRYGQPAKSKQEALSLFNHYLNAELAGNSNLHVDIGYIASIEGVKE